MKTKKKELTRKKVLTMIAESSLYGNLGLFVGAGMSMAIMNDEWETIALSWKQLINKCAEEFDIDLKEEIRIEGLSYPEIASEIAKALALKKTQSYADSVKNLKEKIAELTCWYPGDDKRREYSKILKGIDPSWIITTNYDLILECLLSDKGYSLTPTDQLISPKNLIPIYHLHGIRTNPDSIIISQEDYISLFRPNQYRQQKLALSIKESTTLIIGYGLGDVNVLTAVDWTTNVYSDQKVNYPHGIIQLVRKEEPKDQPYYSHNGIVIMEFQDLQKELEDIKEEVEIQQGLEIGRIRDLGSLNGILSQPTKQHIEQFLDDAIFRNSLVTIFAESSVHLISGFMELFTKCIEETWKRAAPRGAFYAYDQNIILQLDILESFKPSKLPPILLESIAYNLNRVGAYIGTRLGESRAAFNTWKSRKMNIPKPVIKELKSIASTRNYYRLKNLLEL